MDKRKNNGGNSTKSIRPDDKRKNAFRNIITESQTPQDVKNILNMVKNKAIADEDIAAAKLYLEYVVGKPDQTIDVEGLVSPIIDMSLWK